MKETITLQLGSFGCHVGAHYWNIQQELLSAKEDMDSGEHYDSGRLYRSIGRGVQRNLVPRTIVTDLRENLGYMSFQNDRQSIAGYQLRGDERNEDLRQDSWGGAVTHRTMAEAPQLHPFQEFLRNTSSDSYYASVSGGGSVGGGGGGLGVFAGAGAGAGGRGSGGPAPGQKVARPKESSVTKWTDYLETSVPEDQMFNMPIWCTRDNFDSFLTGLPGQALAGDAVSTAFMEGYMDKVRWLAEECDNLNTIQMFADGCDGFGGMSASIVQELHEEYRNVSLPIYTFTKRSASTSTASSTAGMQLQSLSVPYLYSQLYENATVVVPIHPASGPNPYGNLIASDSKLDYHASAVVAAAIEGLTGASYLRRGFESLKSLSEADTYDIAFRATVAGRVPLCHLETLLPLSLYPDANHDALLAPAGFVDSRNAKEDVANVAKATRSGSLNPFMSTLSAAFNSAWKVKPEQREQRYARISNVVSVRGPSSKDLPRNLFVRSHPGQYLIKACFQRQTALYLPKSYPHFFVNTNDFGFQEELAVSSRDSELNNGSMSATAATAPTMRGCLSISLMSALGADSEMGLHIANTASSWRNAVTGSALLAQLEKSNLGPEECLEVTEVLQRMAQCYSE